MVFGMRAHDLGKMKFDELCSKIRDNGISNIHLAFGKSISDIDFSTGNFSTGLAKYLGNGFKKSGVNVGVLGCYINPVNPDETLLETEITKFKEHLLYAKFMGADMVGTETGSYSVNNKPSEMTRTEYNYQYFLQNMKQLIVEAEKLGVLIGVEGVIKDTLYNYKMIRRFLDDANSPCLAVIYDPVNLIEPSDNGDISRCINECIESFGDKIVCIHLKDFIVEEDAFGVLTKKRVPIGEGLMDFKTLFSYIKCKKPYITMMLEESSESRYKDDVAFLQKIYMES